MWEKWRLILLFVTNLVVVVATDSVFAANLVQSWLSWAELDRKKMDCTAPCNLLVYLDAIHFHLWYIGAFFALYCMVDVIKSVLLWVVLKNRKYVEFWAALQYFNLIIISGQALFSYLYLQPLVLTSYVLGISGILWSLSLLCQVLGYDRKYWLHDTELPGQSGSSTKPQSEAAGGYRSIESQDPENGEVGYHGMQCRRQKITSLSEPALYENGTVRGIEEESEELLSFGNSSQTDDKEPTIKSEVATTGHINSSITHPEAAGSISQVFTVLLQSAVDGSENESSKTQQGEEQSQDQVENELDTAITPEFDTGSGSDSPCNHGKALEIYSDAAPVGVTQVVLEVGNNLSLNSSDSCEEYKTHFHYSCVLL